MKSVETEIDYYQMKETTNMSTKELFDKYKKLDKLNRVIIDEFVDKIDVDKLNKETNTRDIEIKWNFE